MQGENNVTLYLLPRLFPITQEPNCDLIYAVAKGIAHCAGSNVRGQEKQLLCSQCT